MNVKLNAKKKHKAKDTGKSHYSFWLQRFPPLGKKLKGAERGQRARHFSFFHWQNLFFSCALFKVTTFVSVRGTKNCPCAKEVATCALAIPNPLGPPAQAESSQNKRLKSSRILLFVAFKTKGSANQPRSLPPPLPRGGERRTPQTTVLT
jgi:hypothetical protein